MHYLVNHNLSILTQTTPHNIVAKAVEVYTDTQLRNVS